MGLLDLPPEPFARTIHLLIEEVGVRDAIKHKLICKTFASEIHQNIIAFQPRPAFKKGFCSPLFARYGAEMLQTRIAAPNGLESNLFKWISRAAQDVILLDEGTTSGLSQEQCSILICKAIQQGCSWTMGGCCIDKPYGLQEEHYQLFLCGAAAASGSTFALSKIINGERGIPLEDLRLTAAATGQHTILSLQGDRNIRSLQNGYSAAATYNYPECLRICLDAAAFLTYAAEAAMFNCVKYGSGEALYEAPKIIHSTDTPAAFDEWTVWDLIQFKGFHPETLRLSPEEPHQPKLLQTFSSYA
jgi:hypothetical protein